MTSSITLYDIHHTHHIIWPEGTYLERHYLSAFMQHKAVTYMSNVNTDFRILRVDDQFFPVTINHTEYDSSYVCSPYTAFILYALEEIKKIPNSFLRTLAKCIIMPMGAVLRAARINKVVCVNNWLLSTNLYPAWDGKAIPEITSFLKENFPEHAIVFRSLNSHSNAELLEKFKNANYRLVPSRQVYILDRHIVDYTKKRDTIADKKKLDKTSYIITCHDDITENDYARISELYRLLYLEKYSYYNPQFTEQFIKLCHQKRLLSMVGLRNEAGVLEGIIGSFEQNGILATPLVGYNIYEDQDKGLYRILTSLIIGNEKNQSAIINLSAGVSHFKRLRGATGTIEYSAVYYKHIPYFRRFVWQILYIILTYFGIPIMQAYEL